MKDKVGPDASTLVHCLAFVTYAIVFDVLDEPCCPSDIARSSVLCTVNESFRDLASSLVNTVCSKCLRKVAKGSLQSCLSDCVPVCDSPRVRHRIALAVSHNLSAIKANLFGMADEGSSEK